MNFKQMPRIVGDLEDKPPFCIIDHDDQPNGSTTYIFRGYKRDADYQVVKEIREMTARLTQPQPEPQLRLI